MKSKPMKPWWIFQISCSLIFSIGCLYSLHLTNETGKLRKEYQQKLLGSEPTINALERDVSKLETEMKQAQKIENEDLKQERMKPLEAEFQNVAQRFETMNSKMEEQRKQIRSREHRATAITVLNVIAALGSLIAVIRIHFFNRSVAAEREQVLQNQ